MIPKDKRQKIFAMLDKGYTQAATAKKFGVSQSSVYKLNRERMNQYGAQIPRVIHSIQPIQPQPIQPQPIIQQPQSKQPVQKQTENNPFKLEPNYTDVSIGARGGISTSNKAKKTGYRYINRNLVYDFDLQRHFMYSIIEQDWIPLNF